MPSETDWLNSIRAFEKREYADCYRMGLKAISSHEGTPELMLIMLICLQRLGDAKLDPTWPAASTMADAYAKQLLSVYEQSGQTWRKLLCELLLGVVSPNELQSYATDASRQSEMHYYSGARLLTLGQAELAAAEFKACLALNANSLEAALALSEVEHRPVFGNAETGVHALVRLLFEQSMTLREEAQLDKALVLAWQACNLAHQHLKADEPICAECVYNLGNIYQLMGDYKFAIRIYEEALQIVRHTVGEAHSSYATGLSNLGTVYRAMGVYAKSLLLHQQAANIMRASVGEHHLDYAGCLHNLAGAYYSLRIMPQAVSCFREALAIKRDLLGDEHLSYARDLNNLATTLATMGDFDEAESSCQKALTIMRKTKPTHDPEITAALINLAQVKIANNCSHEAIALLSEAHENDDHLIDQVLRAGSDAHRTEFIRSLHGKFYGFLSAVWQYESQSEEARRIALDLVFRRKAIAQQASRLQLEVNLDSHNPELQSKLGELQALRERGVREALEGPGTGNAKDHWGELDDLDFRRRRLEEELSSLSPEFNLVQSLRSATCRQVADALPRGTALVEFVRFSPVDFTAVTKFKREHQWLRSRYIVFVLQSGMNEAPAMLDLGDAEAVDEMVIRYREGVMARSGHEDIGRQLRARVLDPVTATLPSSCRELLLAIDGDLSRLPFETLPLEGGGNIIDKYRLSYVVVGRDVLRFRRIAAKRPGVPVVVADPAFDLAAAQSKDTQKQQDSFPASPPSRDLRASKLHFGRLAGSRVEGERIADRLCVEPWMGEQATERRLKKVRSPHILHIATHGFFLNDQGHHPKSNLSWLLASTQEDTYGSGRLLGTLPENPLFRSGLALSGANTWLRGERLPEDAEDGLLTAEDVTAIDLRDTELVVLSACETGLGEVHVGEGVIGLRQSFVLAGAQTIVMSLWKVPDLATAVLMDSFYVNLLRHQLDRNEALRQAQLYVRDVQVGALRQDWLNAKVMDQFDFPGTGARRQLEEIAAKPDSHRPFNDTIYWGAFVCQGNPGPLTASTSRSLPDCERVSRDSEDAERPAS